MNYEEPLANTPNAISTDAYSLDGSHYVGIAGLEEQGLKALGNESVLSQLWYGDSEVSVNKHDEPDVLVDIGGSDSGLVNALAAFPAIRTDDYQQSLSAGSASLDTDGFAFALQDTTRSIQSNSNNGSQSTSLLETTFIDFEGDGLESGSVITNQLNGVTVSTNTQFGAMLFDTANPTGGDSDLRTSDQNHVLIISENGDTSDPDDNAAGGIVRFDFNRLFDIYNVGLLDIDEVGSSITFYGSFGNVIETYDVPEMENNEFRNFSFDVENVAYLEVSLSGSGAIANIGMSPSPDQPFVSIIDTGFSGTHPDLDYSTIFPGYDYVDSDDNPFIASGGGNEHGSHSLGVIRAISGNGIGIDGINSRVPVEVYRAVGSGQWSDALNDAVASAKAQGKTNSIVYLGFDLIYQTDDQALTRTELTPQEREALENARRNNVLIFVPSGNTGGVMSALGQASQEFDNIFTIGSIDGVTSPDYSSRGYGLDILADGGTAKIPVISTVGEGYGTMHGSSVAAAKVAGAASLLWTEYPDLSAQQIAYILRRSAVDLNTPGWDEETGYGAFDLISAMALASETEPVAYSPKPFQTPTTWLGEDKGKPGERPAAVEFNGKYYEFDVRYVVQDGDTLSELTEAAIGNGTEPYYNFVAQQNGIADPNEIDEDDVIWLPREVEAPNPPSDDTPTFPPSDPPLNGGNSVPYPTVDEFMGKFYEWEAYRIQPGDTLSEIALQRMGSGSAPYYNFIAQKNGISDPNWIFAGHNILVPKEVEQLTSPIGIAVGDPFTQVHSQYRSTLGEPTSEVITHFTGAQYQLFQGGSIVSSNAGISS